MNDEKIFSRKYVIPEETSTAESKPSVEGEQHVEEDEIKASKIHEEGFDSQYLNNEEKGTSEQEPRQLYGLGKPKRVVVTKELKS